MTLVLLARVRQLKTVDVIVRLANVSNYTGSFAVLIVLFTGSTGCRSQPDPVFCGGDYRPLTTEIEYPDACIEPVSATEPLEPHTLREPTPEDHWSLSLDEVVRIALANSQVVRELGVRVIGAPQSMTTIYDPALQQTSPLTGEEAALSDFDAQLATSLLFNQDVQAANDPASRLLGLTGESKSERTDFVTDVSKVAATGTRFSLSNVTTRSGFNITSPNGRIRVAPFYTTLFQAEARHPLLRGGGLGFNRIAGPNGVPGSYNGIVIARIRTDLAVADFERSVRDFLEDVQQTYWQLYFAYRNLDARIAARDAALESWRTAKNQLVAGAGDILDESLAREQYYQFQVQVGDVLSGTGTDTSLTQTGFGVYSLERRLRLLMGIDINDGRLIRPSEEPLRAEVVFDWNETVQRAHVRRVELRRQQWIIKQRELELLASRNLQRVRLDLVGQYRWRGLGDDLFGERSRPAGSAFRSLWFGDLDGWQMGVELSTPIGNRIGNAAVRNAELSLSRERALLREQQRHIHAELSDAFNDLDRAFMQTKNNYNRTLSARQRLKAERTRYDVGDGILRFVFDAQSRAADAEAEMFRSVVDYNLAIAKIHYAQGTLLDYLGVHLAEGPWSAAAHQSAAKESTRFTRSKHDCITQPCPISRGTYPQSILHHGTRVSDETDVPTPDVSAETVDAYPGATALPANTDVPTDRSDSLPVERDDVLRRRTPPVPE